MPGSSDNSLLRGTMTIQVTSVVRAGLMKLLMRAQRQLKEVEVEGGEEGVGK